MEQTVHLFIRSIVKARQLLVFWQFFLLPLSRLHFSCPSCLHWSCPVLCCLCLVLSYCLVLPSFSAQPNPDPHPYPTGLTLTSTLTLILNLTLSLPSPLPLPLLKPLTLSQGLRYVNRWRGLCVQLGWRKRSCREEARVGWMAKDGDSEQNKGAT